jgi:hypothetical protein
MLLSFALLSPLSFLVALFSFPFSFGINGAIFISLAP